MKRSHTPAFAVFLAAAAAVTAAEPLTIQPGGFTIRHTIHAQALPAESELIAIDAGHWSAFEITRIVDHGAAVKKGDVLVAFDAEDLTRTIDDHQRTIARRELEIAAAHLELANLTDTADERLEAARRAAKEAAVDHESYVNIRHAVDVEAAGEAVKRAEQRLQSAEEELRQLLRMYEADDLVEETEEIILIRQREAVETARFLLRVERLDQKQRVEVDLPRKIVTLLEKKNETARLLAIAEEEIPREITLKQADLLALKTTRKREKETLAKLTADRALLEIRAPANGTFYHGTIADGTWTTGELVKTLAPGGRPPVKKPFATFIPVGTALTLHARLDQATALSFGGEKPSGLASLRGREDVAIPVSLTALSATPGADGRHPAAFTAGWPGGLAVAPGAGATIDIIAYAREQAIHVPAKALDFGANGWQVEVKLADGKTEKRAVTRGRVDDDQIEILDGLEAGQVIVLP